MKVDHRFNARHARTATTSGAKFSINCIDRVMPVVNGIDDLGIGYTEADANIHAGIVYDNEIDYQLH